MDVVTALSRPPDHHFFGYYGIDPWHPGDRRRHLALAVARDDRVPSPGERAGVGWVDAGDGSFVQRSETLAWNLQQGAMLHWLRVGERIELSLNDLDRDGRSIARVLDPDGPGERRLEAAIAAVATDGRAAIGLDYARMFHCRTVVGCSSDLPESAVADLPADNGLWAIDLATGRRSLLLSIAALTARCDLPADARAWFNHACYAPDGARLLFFCRYRRPPDQAFTTSVWVLDLTTGEPRCLTPFGVRSSHYEWLDEHRVLLSTDLLGTMGFCVIDAVTGEAEAFGGGQLPADGHACISPDRRWLLGDRYPAGPGRMAMLWLLELASGRYAEVAEVHSPPRYVGDIRCDLHPRWHPDGTSATIDSVHTGTRQIHHLDLAPAMDTITQA